MKLSDRSPPASARCVIPRLLRAWRTFAPSVTTYLPPSGGVVRLSLRAALRYRAWRLTRLPSVGDVSFSMSRDIDHAWLPHDGRCQEHKRCCDNRDRLLHIRLLLDVQVALPV